jgi:hypothetical protein
VNGYPGYKRAFGNDAAAAIPARSGMVEQQESTELFTTAVTVAEILYGIEVLSYGKRRAALLAGQTGCLAKYFSGGF